MRALWEVSGLCICLILSRLFHAVMSIVYVENGMSLTLKPNIQGKPEDVLWTHNGNKVAEHDLTEFQDYSQFKERSEIEVSTGQLTVHNMTSRDNGIYRSVIQISGKLQNSEKEVQVIDAVPEPTVTCKLNTSSRALLCSVSSQSPVSYEWTGSGSAQGFGPELHVSRDTPDSVYTCTVRNEVSRKSSSFSLEHCDTDESQSDQNIILPVAVSCAILVIIAVAVGIFLIQRRKQNENSSRSGGEDGNQAPRNSDDAAGNRTQDTGQSHTSQFVDYNEDDRMNGEESKKGGDNEEEEDASDEDKLTGPE